jgi:hypothetical protein
MSLRLHPRRLRSMLQMMMLAAGPTANGRAVRARQPPKVISPSDPQSAWTAKANKRVQFGYVLNCLIDIENAVIADGASMNARFTRTQFDFPTHLRAASPTGDAIGPAFHDPAVIPPSLARRVLRRLARLMLIFCVGVCSTSQTSDRRARDSGPSYHPS